MTIEDEYKLSFYKEIGYIDEKKDIKLVKHIENNDLYVKKKIKIFNRDVYQKLMEYRFKNIPQIYLLVEEEDYIIVIEEYIHGKSLEKILEERGGLSEKESVDIILKVCDILEQLHSIKPIIVHRDIKPSNIMISNDNVVKLIDFNAARCVEQKGVSDTYFMGTVNYAAPEQYGFGQSDARTDIYGMAITLNIMLTGDVPKKSPVADGLLRHIIDKATKMDPDERYQNIKSFREAFSKKKEYRRKRKWQEYLPVGFRSLNLIKMIPAALCYFFIFLVARGFSLEDIQINGAAYVFLKFLVAFLFIGIIFISGNYLDIRKRLIYYPGKPIINFIFTLVYILVFMVVWFVFTVLYIAVFAN